MLEFICYNKCSTCRKAEKFLVDNNITFIKRDIVVDNPKHDEIKKWISKYRLDIDKLFNTSGLLYKEQDIKNKKHNMSFEDKLKVLSSNGKMLKRPILLSSDDFINGFKEEDYLKIINKGS